MKKLLFFILLLPVQLLAATPTINGTPVEGYVTESNVVTVSATVAAGSNRLAIITLAAMFISGTGINTGSSVQFNGAENAVFIGGCYGDYTGIEQWYLKMPTVTTANFVGTWGAGHTNTFTAMSIVVVDGANQSGAPNRTQACQSDEVGTTQPDINVTAVSGDLSIDGIMTWNDAITDPDAGQTERTDTSATGGAGGSSLALNTSTETATDTATEMGWTKSGSDNYSQYCGVSIIGASAGNGLLLLGVGQ